MRVVIREPDPVGDAAPFGVGGQAEFFRKGGGQPKRTDRGIVGRGIVVLNPGILVHAADRLDFITAHGGVERYPREPEIGGAGDYRQCASGQKRVIAGNQVILIIRQRNVAGDVMLVGIDEVRDGFVAEFRAFPRPLGAATAGADGIAPGSVERPVAVIHETAPQRRVQQCHDRKHPDFVVPESMAAPVVAGQPHRAGNMARPRTQVTVKLKKRVADKFLEPGMTGFDVMVPQFPPARFMALPDFFRPNGGKRHHTERAVHGVGSFIIGGKRGKFGDPEVSAAFQRKHADTFKSGRRTAQFLAVFAVEVHSQQRGGRRQAVVDPDTGGIDLRRGGANLAAVIIPRLAQFLNESGVDPVGHRDFTVKTGGHAELNHPQFALMARQINPVLDMKRAGFDLPFATCRDGGGAEIQHLPVIAPDPVMAPETLSAAAQFQLHEVEGGNQ